MLEQLQDFTATIPAMWQWAVVALISAIPFVESYFGSAIGVLAGIPLPLAVAAAVVGNFITVAVVVLVAGRIRSGVKNRKAESVKEASASRQKIQRQFDKYGIAGVSLLGQFVLPSQLTAATLVSITGNQRKVMLWQGISILVWGTAFGLLVHAGLLTITG